MSEHDAENDVTCQPGEGVTAFSVRRIQHDAWVAGHDSGCAVSLHPCWHHPSPFADGAHTRVTPPGSTHSDRGHANANRVALTGLIVVGLGTGASFAHPYLAWWMIPLVFLWLLAGVAIACVVGGGEH